MAELRVSELPTAVTLDDSDLLLLSQPDANSDTGYASAKTTNVALATKVVKQTNFSELQTTSKNVIGAINEISGAASSLVDLNDVDITTPSDGECLQYDGTSQKWKNKDILAVNETTLTEPYVYKQVPNGKYTEKLKKIIGASVVWNQLCKKFTTRTSGDITATVDTDGKVTFSGTSTGNFAFAFIGSAENRQVFSGHKYLINLGTLTSDKNNYFVFRIPDGTIFSSTNVKETHNESIVVNVTESGTATLALAGGANTAVSGSVYPMLIDLTAEFNTTIADYVYSLEQTQAGSGIAWLKSYGFFTESYYAYSANTMQSVSLSGHKIVGLNQWDEQWELGSYDASGNPTSSTTLLRSKSTNYINVFPNTEYYVKVGSDIDCIMYFYDSGKNFIQSISRKNITFTTPANARYMRFRMGSTYGTTYNNDICINISGAKNGTYEPYHAETTALDHTTLRGLFKLDANNNLYADGDIYNADGRGEVNYEKRAYQAGDESLSDAITDGTNTVVKLVTPTTATLTPFNPLSDIEQGGTEEFIDYGVQQSTRDVAIPCGNESVYGDNKLMGEIIKYINN